MLIWKNNNVSLINFNTGKFVYKNGVAVRAFGNGTSALIFIGNDLITIATNSLILSVDGAIVECHVEYGEMLFKIFY